MTDRFVDPDVIQDRFQRLLALQMATTLERNRGLVGRRIEVLSEGPSKRDEEVATTRTRGGKVVHVEGRIPAGTFLEVDVVDAAQYHLTGRPI